MRIRLNEKSKSKSSKSKSKAMRAASTWWRGFDEPLLLAGEDAALYRDLQARVHAAVQPVDIIEEILVDDVTSLVWEILRWRKLKTTRMRACGLKALETFLQDNLDYTDRFLDF